MDKNIEKDLYEFGTKLYNLRMEKGYSLRDLEDISDKVYHQRVAKGSWSKYEKGMIEPGLTKLRMISDIYGVTLDYLVGLTDDRNGHATESKTEKNLDSGQVALLKAFDNSSEIQQKVVRNVLNIRKKIPNKKETGD